MFKNKKIAPSLIDHAKYEGTHQNSYFRVVKSWPEWKRKALDTVVKRNS